MGWQGIPQSASKQRVRHRQPYVGAVLVLQYTDHFKSVKLLNKRTKKHLEGSAGGVHACTLEDVESSVIPPSGGSPALGNSANVYAVSLTLSRIFSALVEDADHSVFPDKGMVALKKDVTEPERLKVMQAAWGAPTSVPLSPSGLEHLLTDPWLLPTTSLLDSPAQLRVTVSSCPRN